MAATLKTLLEGIYGAVIEARHYVNAQHSEMFRSYFDKKVVDDPITGPTEVYVPKLVSFASSKFVDGLETFDITDAPQAALLPLSTLAIETLEIEFDAKLTNLNLFEEAADEARAKDEAEKDQPPEEEGFLKRTYDEVRNVADDISVMIKGENMETSASSARVKVVFKLKDPPEGVTLIQEQLLDYLRD